MKMVLVNNDVSGHYVILDIIMTTDKNISKLEVIFMEKKTFRSLPLDRLQYILDLLDVKRHRKTNIYVLQEINNQIDEFEKDYNVSIINEWLNVYYDDL